MLKDNKSVIHLLILRVIVLQNIDKMFCQTFHCLFNAIVDYFELRMSHLTLFNVQIDTSRQLEWLKGVEKSHGSVAKSSLMEAKAINEHGVYRVGCVSEDVEKSIETLTLDAVIQLKLPTDEKRFTLDDLKDLQSKLMLIAAKASSGKEDVDRFVDVSLLSTF